MCDPMSVLVVDDEPPARESLRLLLEARPGMKLIAECGDGNTAVSMIRAHRPDLVLLDVQMPGLDGFDVIRTIGADQMPHVVFVTAFDRYALEAFEVSAVDYLLKPFSDERFAAAMGRVCRRRRDPNRVLLSTQLAAVLSELEALRTSRRDTAADLIAVPGRGRVRLVDPASISWVEAADDYVRLHVGADSYLLRGTMSDIEGRLDPNVFARIHRSTIVNVTLIAELIPQPRGDAVVILRDGTRLRLSRSHRKNLADRFGMPR